MVCFANIKNIKRLLGRVSTEHSHRRLEFSSFQFHLLFCVARILLFWFTQFIKALFTVISLFTPSRFDIKIYFHLCFFFAILALQKVEELTVTTGKNAFLEFIRLWNAFMHSDSLGFHKACIPQVS